MRVLLLICIISCHYKLARSKLPDVIKKCYRTEEHINECISESIELLRNNLAHGDFGEDFNIPRIEPLSLPEIRINRGHDYNEMVFKNLLVSGPSQFVLKDMKANIDNKTFDFNLELPQLDFKGDYSLALKLFVKISGTGKFKGQFKNSIAKVTAIGTTTGDLTQFNLNVKLKVDYAHFQMESLLLSSFGNKLINDNYKVFLRELVPGLEDSLSSIFSDIVNTLLKTSTYEEMFPACPELQEDILEK